MASPKKKIGPKNRQKKQQPKFSKRQRAVESEDMRSESKLTPDTRGSDTDFHSGTPNDWRWYAQNPQLVHDYASYPFGAPVGNLMQYGNPTYDGQSVPGVCAIYFSPAIGFAADENSPINVAMRRLYSYVRHANSGASNYDAPDLMLYMLSVDSAVMYHEYLKRAYGVLQDYTPFNRYYPKVLIEAMGMNFDDLVANIAAFRGYINQFAIKLSQLWIPNSMSYMARHAWMCQGIYTDSTSEKAQTYMYVPDYFMQFALDSDGVGSVNAIPGPARSSTKAKFSDLVDFGNSLLNPMIANEDFGIMSGDILKAFGSSGIVRPLAITENYQILPVYNQEVLSQMENATIFNLSPLGTDNTLFSVKQATAVGTGYLTSTLNKIQMILGESWSNGEYTNLACTAIANVYAQKRLLNMHHSGVTPEEVMVATRLTNIIEKPSSWTFQYNTNTQQLLLTADIRTVGSEIVTRARVFSITGNTSTGVSTGVSAWSFATGMAIGVNALAKSGGGVTDLNKFANVLNGITKLSAFDWHPPVFLSLGITVQSATSGGSNVNQVVTPTAPFQDIDYYTFLDKNNLYNMTNAALLSEFSIPQI